MKRKKKLEFLNETILLLNQRKDLLESMAADLKKDADEFAYKSEHKTKLRSQETLKSSHLKNMIFSSIYF